MIAEQTSQMLNTIDAVATILKAGHLPTENDEARVMRDLLVNQPQVEKRVVYALAELFRAIDSSSCLLQEQQQIDAVFILADELYAQLLDILQSSELSAVIAQQELKALFITGVVDFATCIRMGYSIDQQRYELMLLNLEQLIVRHRHTSFIDKDLAHCCIDCFVALYLPTNVYQEQDRQVLQQRIHTLQNKIKMLLAD